MKSGKRPLWKAIMSSPLTLVAFSIILFFIAKAAWNINRQVTASANRLANAEASLAALEARKTDLSHKVDNLSTDKGVESEIRSKYHAVNDGEMVAVILQDEATTSVAATAEPELSWWQRILRAIGL